MILPACSRTDWFNEPMAVVAEPDTIGMNPMSRYLVVVGDIQEYTQSPDEYMSYFRQSMDWLVVQQSFFNNIDAVVQVGDITNGNFEWQWNNAARSPACGRSHAVYSCDRQSRLFVATGIGRFGIYQRPKFVAAQFLSFQHP